MKPTFESRGDRRVSVQDDSSLVESSPSWSGCVVFGLQSDRREFLVQAARSAGWAAVECDQEDVNVSSKVIEGQRLIIFDLETKDGITPTSLQGSAERVVRQKGILIVLCGNEGNVAEEIWARQLGIWLYLPGAVDNVDLEDVFEEAARLSEKRHENRDTTGNSSPVKRRTNPK